MAIDTAGIRIRISSRIGAAAWEAGNVLSQRAHRAKGDGRTETVGRCGGVTIAAIKRILPGA